jgi:hypothetical protein
VLADQEIRFEPPGTEALARDLFAINVFAALNRTVSLARSLWARDPEDNLH